MILKRCNKPGCIQHIPRSQHPPYCQQHRLQQSRQYDKTRDKQTTSFYKSREWQRFRLMILNDRMHLCEICQQHGELNAADTVHHVIELKDDWSKRLDSDNVQAICRACHNRIHERGFMVNL